LGRAFVNVKIMVNSIIDDRSNYSYESISEGYEFKYLSEWDLGSEKEFVREFYEYLENLLKEEGIIIVVGFNILRFDIPLIIQKSVEYRGSLSEFNKLWHDVFTLDLFQIALSFNRMMFKGNGNKLENLATGLREKGFEVPEPIGKGGNVPK
jgi:hypothetical protein